MQVVNLPLDLPTRSIEEWMTSWVGMPSPTEPADPTKLQEIPSTSPSKTIYVKEFFMI
jgi:hypothetical protein